MPYKKEVTIRDVSKKAGISIATVSRVLNNPDKVKKETREKVLKTIEEMNFVPSSSLAQNKIHNAQDKFVYLFMPNIFNESITAIAQGASDYLAKHNVSSVIWNSNESTDMEQLGRQFIRNHPSHGAIFILSTVEDIPLDPISSLMPVAAIEYTREEKDVDYLHVDNDQSMDLLVEHLVELGHKNIAFLCGDISSSNAVHKITAYKKALQSHQIPWDASNILSTGWNVEGGYNGIQKLLEWSPDITAVICISDILALGAVHGLEKMGLKCPEDISVTGFDNMPSSSCIRPRLTTLSFPGYQMGQDAAKQILRKIEDKKTPDIHRIYPVEIIVGTTTGKVKT